MGARGLLCFLGSLRWRPPHLLDELQRQLKLEFTPPLIAQFQRSRSRPMATHLSGKRIAPLRYDAVRRLEAKAGSTANRQSTAIPSTNLFVESRSQAVHPVFGRMSASSPISEGDLLMSP